MPGTPAPVANESAALVAYLRQQRDGLKNAAFGLSEEELRLRPTRSGLNVGGLIKHATQTEAQWIDIIVGRPPGVADADGYRDTFAVTEEESRESLIAQFDQVAARTEAAITGLDSLDGEIDLPEAPWFPRGGGYTARWALFHVLEELARHAGHADIIREHIDGATMYELLAGAEGWPETDWLKPWRPKAASASS